MQGTVRAAPRSKTDAHKQVFLGNQRRRRRRIPLQLTRVH